MTKQLKYVVKIPLPNTNPIQYKECKFHDKKEVCDYLEIKPNTFMRLSNNTLTFSHKNVQHLKGIIIGKIPVIKNTVENKLNQTPEQYIEKLLSKEVP